MKTREASPTGTVIFTNMYPSEGDVAWRGVFIKEQVESFKSYFNLDIKVFHIKGAISAGGSNLNYIKWIFKYLYQSFSQKIRVVHCHHFLTVLIAKLNPFVRIVYTVHEGELDAKTKKAALIQRSIAFSDVVIYVNEKMFSLSAHKNKYLIPSSIDLQKFFEEDKVVCRKTLGLDTEKFYIFFPACPKRPEKNANFLNAFVAHNKCFIDENSIEVLWGGNIEYNKMRIYMNAVDILVSFSNYESDGMVFKEAMACNLPVICFNVGNAQLYFGDEQSGSIIDKDYCSLKSKIIYWQKNASKGRAKLVSLSLDAKDTAGKLYEIYESQAKTVA